MNLEPVRCLLPLFILRLLILTLNVYHFILLTIFSIRMGLKDFILKEMFGLFIIAHVDLGLVLGVPNILYF